MKLSRITRPLASALVACSLLAGCQGMPVDFSQRSVKDRAQIDGSAGRRISGEATGFQLMLFIPIAVNGRIANAYGNLLKEAGDDLITDVTVTESWQWAFVGTLYRTRIEATAHPRKPGVGSPAAKTAQSPAGNDPSSPSSASAK